MTGITCTACGSAQDAGASWCAVCGTAIARPEVAASVHTGTTVPERMGTTVRGLPVPDAPQGAQAGPGAAAGSAWAGTGRRFAAWLIDMTAVGVLPAVVMLVGVARAGGASGLLADAGAEDLPARLAGTYLLATAVMLLGWLAVVVADGLTGRTVGGLLLGLRTVDIASGRPIGVGRSLLRWLIVGASGLVFVIGQLIMVLSPAFDSGPCAQGWHDKAVRAGVVRSGRRGPRAEALAPAATGGPAAPQGRVPDPWSFPAGAPQPGAPAGLVTGVPKAAGSPGVEPSPTAATPVVPASAASAPPLPAPSLPIPPLSAPSLSAPPGSAPVRPVNDPAGGEPRRVDEVDGETRMIPAVPRVLIIELASGERHAVTGRTLVGRNPQAPTGEPWDVVAVPDPTRSVSKTHAELHPDAGGLWLVDRGSTNGTVVSVPGRAPQVAAPGARVRVTVGATVHVGDARILIRAGVS